MDSYNARTCEVCDGHFATLIASILGFLVGVVLTFAVLY